MKLVKRSAICLLVASVSSAWCASAQAQSSQVEIKSFVAKYVAAFNARDAARLYALYHPAVVACITPETKSYYDGALAVQWRDQIPATYTFRVMPVNEDNVKALESIARFRIRPAQEVQIDYQQGDDVGSVTVWLVRENNRLYSDAPCATEEALKQFRDEAPAREAFTAQHRALAAAVAEPLRSQLIALVRAHKTAEAITKYKEASGLDYRMAIFVIDDLAHER
jgi:SnoaL-like protein